MTCPLCVREPRTHCYHEDELVWVVDCSSCGTPMIVWKAHVDQLTPADNQHVCQVLYDLFGHFEVDGIRRTYPDHWHAHLRGEEGFSPADNPVDPKISSHLSRLEVEMLNRLEADMLAASAAATAAYEAEDFVTAEREDARYIELQEQLEAISSEVLEGGVPLVGGSELQEGFELDVTQFLAKIWAEYLRYPQTDWATGGLDLSNKQRLAEYLRLNLRYDLVEGVTDTQLLEAAEDAYNARIGYFERGVRRRQMEDRVLAKLGDLDAQRRLYRDEDQARRDLELEQRRRLSGNPGGLQRRTARRGDLLFETGVPVTFKAMRSTEPAPWMGARFGQDLEPAGTYLLVDDYDQWKDPRAQVRGWVYFKQHFSDPLVIAMVADDDPMAEVYGPTGWKQRLSEHFGGATGAELTQAILAVGHDGVVTVGPARNDVREVVDLTRLPRSAAHRAKKNPLDPEAWSAESQPCALARPMGPCPDDREGVHFALSWGLAARYALFKASRSGSIGVILTYDLSGLSLEPDHDAVIEKSHGDYMVKEISYYIEEFDILEDPDEPDYDRLASLMEGEAESEGEGRESSGDYSVEQQLIENAKGSIFMLLSDRLVDPETQEQALEAIKNADVPKDWWAEAIGQMRTFSVVGDERLLRVQALKPVEDSISADYPEDLDEAACPVQLTIEDLDFALADTLEGMAVTLWERPDADQVVEPYFHGTDLTRAEVILEAAPAGAELRNPWEPCTQP